MQPAIPGLRPGLPVITRAGWQCPECRTVYSPDVRQCDCATVKRSLAERIEGTFTQSPVHQPAQTLVIC
jgi:hypothetical protein